MPVVNYLWNPLNDNIVREFDDSGTAIAEYTTEASHFGNVVSQRRNGQDSVYHYDGQGSTLALTDNNGDVTDTYAYSAFGEVTASTGSTVNPFRYIGQKGYYHNTETGEYDIRRRPFASERGRWLSPDPFLPSPTVNRYEYVMNRPTFDKDSSGLLGDKGWSAPIFDTVEKAIQDAINDRIDPMVEEAIATLDKGIDGAFGLLGLLSPKCFKMTINLTSVSFPTTSVAIPPGLPLAKRIACGAMAVAASLAAWKAAAARIKSHFPHTRTSQCPPDKVCDNKWAAVGIPLPPTVAVPLATVAIPLEIAVKPKQICTITMSLALAPTGKAFVANCVVPCVPGGRSIDPIFLP